MHRGLHQGSEQPWLQRGDICAFILQASYPTAADTRAVRWLDYMEENVINGSSS